jgi:hypothetical protein
LRSIGQTEDRRGRGVGDTRFARSGENISWKGECFIGPSSIGSAKATLDCLVYKPEVIGLGL